MAVEPPTKLNQGSGEFRKLALLGGQQGNFTLNRPYLFVTDQAQLVIVPVKMWCA